MGVKKKDNTNKENENALANEWRQTLISIYNVMQGIDNRTYYKEGKQAK